MKTGTAVSVRCDKCNGILINGTINVLNTRIQDATCDTCMVREAYELPQCNTDVLTLEESNDILDNCKSDMKRIHVIADIFK